MLGCLCQNKTTGLRKRSKNGKTLYFFFILLIFDVYCKQHLKGILWKILFLNCARLRTVTREAAHGGSQCQELVGLKRCNSDACQGGKTFLSIVQSELNVKSVQETRLELTTMEVGEVAQTPAQSPAQLATQKASLVFSHLLWLSKGLAMSTLRCRSL